MTNTTTRKITAGPEARARAYERQQAAKAANLENMLERYAELYNRDLEIHGEEYAEIMWGDTLRKHGRIF